MKYNNFFYGLVLIFLSAFLQTEVVAQQSVDFWGNSTNTISKKLRLNSFELNSVNFSSAKDWEISSVYGMEFAPNTVSNNLYLLSISKKIGKHYLYGRFTPGLQMEFDFSSGSNIVLGDTVGILNSNIKYKEKFGLGYAYNFSDNFSVGLTFRYLTEELSEDRLIPVFSDTLNYFASDNQFSSTKFWRGDFGIRFSPLNNLAISITSYNLFLIKDFIKAETEIDFEMDKSKGVIFGVDYLPNKFVGLTTRYETSSSFTAGINTEFSLFGQNIILGTSIFHDVKQTPYIAGIIPSLVVSRNNFSISLTWFNYASNRKLSEPIDRFTSNKISNIFNNQYSRNKLLVSANISLSFIPEAKLKLIDVKIVKEIFPTMAEQYVNSPFAFGKVVNISDEIIEVKPSSFISLINNERIESPAVKILPGDTSDIPFFTIIAKSKSTIKKHSISDANFYVSTNLSGPEEKLQKPILVNDVNSWDGKVSTLKYFLDSDYQSAVDYAKSILSEHKLEIDNADANLKKFVQIKILFNNFSKTMVYVADPRSSVEYVQFPDETLKLKGGDCDDLSAAFGALLESVGIQTAFVDYKSEDGVSHVNLLVNTNIPARYYQLITNNDKKYYLRKNITGKDEIWIPLETTALTNFENAWETAAEKFQKEAIEELGLAKSKVVIVDIY